MNCKICKTGKLEFDSFVKDYWVTGEEFRLLKCNQCAVVCTQVQVSEDFFDRYYETSYYAHSNEFLRFCLREQLQRDSVRIKRGERLSFLSRIKNYLLAGMVLVDLPAVENGKILDVGCGAGKLLSVASSVGYECHGVEPSYQAREILKELGFNGYDSLIDMTVPSKHFDVIIFNQSLEHFPDPMAALEKALEILSDDGLLIISVPNYASNERCVFGDYWRHVDVPRHLFHFSPNTLDFIATNNNLSINKTVFKFLGIPISTFKLVREKQGLHAYFDIALWAARQAMSLLQFDRDSYGQMMSYYFCKRQNVKNDATPAR